MSRDKSREKQIVPGAQEIGFSHMDLNADNTLLLYLS